MGIDIRWVNLSKNEVFYSPIDKHRAEAILHYTDFASIDIADITDTWECNPQSKCKVVNCPYTTCNNICCINFKSLESPNNYTVPKAILLS